MNQSADTVDSGLPYAAACAGCILGAKPPGCLYTSGKAHVGRVPQTGCKLHENLHILKARKHENSTDSGLEPSEKYQLDTLLTNHLS